MANLETAKQIIDAHAAAVQRMIGHVESSSGLGPSILSSLSPLAISQVETMAAVEEALHRSLSKDDLQAAKEYAETKLAQLRERAFRELPKVGINTTFTATDMASIDALVSARARAMGDTRYSYAVGFIVCHRKCCQNDAGNGVAAGIGCYDCNDHVISESCPPV